MSPLIQFPSKFLGRLKRENILNSIKRVELTDNSLVVSFSNKIAEANIEAFATFFEISLKRENKGECYLLTPMFYVRKTIKENRLIIHLPIRKSPHLPSRTDKITFFHCNNRKNEKEFKINS